MMRHGRNILHEHAHVRENGVIDVLQHVIGSVAGSRHLVGGVNQAVAQRLYFKNIALNVKLGDNLLQIFLFHGRFVGYEYFVKNKLQNY